MLFLSYLLYFWTTYFTCGIIFIYLWIAAELAAKKSRVKQSLIKRARSVAIFSLKLKERRAREAEKHAYDLAEQEKVCQFACVWFLKFQAVNEHSTIVFFPQYFLCFFILNFFIQYWV